MAIRHEKWFTFKEDERTCNVTCSGKAYNLTLTKAYYSGKDKDGNDDNIQSGIDAGDYWVVRGEGAKVYAPNPPFSQNESVG